MTLPDGFRVTLFAGEPDLVKPIAMTFDDRGRLWVIEAHSYPHWITDGREGHDRILIFEDRKGTGHYDKCTVFWDRGTNLSGIAVGFGGVWLCSTPNLVFLPVRDGEDHPAGPPRVVLDGWDLKAQHNVFNDLTWGPNGWLYGCNGILSNSRIGKPGTPDKERLAIDCGVWRYHPVKQRFEAYAWGTTNPWGLDWDDVGEMFITNCVIKHLFHVVPGAHFQRMYGQDLNPHCYGLIESCADHLHWAGGNWTTSRGGLGAHSETGGGHAHCGAMVYLGDNWPDAYRNHIFMCNIHGNRLNQDVLERRGSGYVAHHGKDFLMAHDDWFRGVSLFYGPDGGVFVSDWHDTGECHNHDVVQPCGRIFKVTYGAPAPVAVDLTKTSDEELVRLQLHKNDWWVRHARRLLQERANAGTLSPKARPLLAKMLAEQTDVPRKLRLVWALYAVGGLDEKGLADLLKDPAEAVRVWAVRLLIDDDRVSSEVAETFAAMARDERAAAVRLALASAMQRLSLAQRRPVAEALAAHAEDAADANLPLMIWYGTEPLVAADQDWGVSLLETAHMPIVRQYVARRIAEAADTGPGGEAAEPALASVVRLLASSGDPQVQLDLVRGVSEALQGRRQVKAPAGWDAASRTLAASGNAEVREKALLLSVIFGDPKALASLRNVAADPKAAPARRENALQTLREAQAPDLLPLLRTLLADPAMRRPALRALAGYNEADIPALILHDYGSWDDATKADAVATLASRPAWAMALLDAMEKGQVPRRDLSAFTARQLLSFNDKHLAERLTKVWGAIRQTSQEKTTLMPRYLGIAAPDALKKADRSHGRLIFTRTCANCHTLFGEGGKIGPDLTGSQRTNPEYLLSKILDPSAVVAKDYQVTILATADGRTLTGIVKEETDKTITLQTQNEVVRVAKADVEDRQRSPASMMPEGQLGPLSDTEVRDLIAYLAGSGQVPMPPKPPTSPAKAGPGRR
jgi:putative membrane-bound dehydrogenase-like protein